MTGSATLSAAATASGLDDATLQLLRARLAERERELRARVRDERERLGHPGEAGVGRETGVGDRGDDAQADESGDEALAMLGHDRVQLEAVEAALQRIGAGSYGVCVQCGEPVGLARLQALPEATKCLGCQGAQESHAHR